MKKKSLEPFGLVQGMIMDTNFPWVTMLTDDGRILIVNWLLAQELDENLPDIFEDE